MPSVNDLHTGTHQDKERVTLNGLWKVTKAAFKNLGRNNVIKMSASLAYFTIITIGPMLIVVLFLANLFWQGKAAGASLVAQVSELLGPKAAFQIQQIIDNTQLDTDGIIASILGFALVFIGASTVFSDMQNSLNRIWQLRAKTDRGWLQLLITRLMSFAMVASLGFLMLVSLVVNALLDILRDRLQTWFDETAYQIVYAINVVLVFGVITFLFAFIFRVLPDARIRWRDVLPGALLTATLFTMAHYGVVIFFGRTDIGSMYGAAGSLVLLLIWIFVSSMVLYIGAEFTKAYTMRFGAPVVPHRYAVTVRNRSIESGKRTVQENETDTDEEEDQSKEESKQRAKRSS